MPDTVTKCRTCQRNLGCQRNGIYYGGCSAYVPLDTRGTMVSNHTEDDTMTTKEQILAIRKSTGLSQARFGQRFGIPKRTIQEWEAGNRDCPAYVAELLAFAAKTDYHTPRLEEEEHFPETT